MSIPYLPKRGDRFKAAYCLTTSSATLIQEQLKTTHTCLDSGADAFGNWVKYVADGAACVGIMVSNGDFMWTFYAVGGSIAYAPEVTRQFISDQVREKSEQKKVNVDLRFDMKGGFTEAFQKIFDAIRKVNGATATTSGIGFGQALVDMHTDDSAKFIDPRREETAMQGELQWRALEV